ncbi:hypothetical protein RHE_CH02530 [Rhizobium etli CFN 42]|uniref:Uncharacterized protein n=1 Tax=Rhizobium etli (strain ATCC 51251 / DSM 11541 / JCM 21823 / NBRC 15573 / CFN 42) TaxID=347834 RepID=Q2K781_RHIEC|nr:hypothetical protein RHE_CH02530 [Rhizobium etli CFN 42]
MLRHLTDYRTEFSSRHVRAFAALLDVPKLDEDLSPGLGIGTAIKCRELARLDLGDMIARIHRPAIVMENQRRVLVAGERIKQLTEADLLCLNFIVVDGVHLR